MSSSKPTKPPSGKEISSSTTLSFTSHLSSLINNNTTTSSTPKPKPRTKPKRDDIFSSHNRNTAKRAKLDLLNASSPAFEQNHTTHGETLDKGTWERSKRKMEEKARLYNAMKRGDVEDVEERFGVDFDRKWALSHQDELSEQDDSTDDNGDDGDDDGGVEGEEEEEEEEEGLVEYTDEFGRTRTGTRLEAARATRTQQARADLASDRFTARPTAPSTVIRGDTIQTAAFQPDSDITFQMEELAAKRDKSLTPPPDTHFDASAEVRRKGTGFFQFSADKEERREQMAGLEEERMETEKRRREREGRVEERKKVVEARRKEVEARRGKRKAEVFLEGLGLELGEKLGEQRGEGRGREVVERFEAAVAREEENE